MTVMQAVWGLELVAASPVQFGHVNFCARIGNDKAVAIHIARLLREKVGRTASALAVHDAEEMNAALDAFSAAAEAAGVRWWEVQP